jgi:prepilin-type processing-associated H-X9-DG protein
MLPRRFTSVALLSLLTFTALPSVAQGPGSPSTIYLGQGRVLDAAPPRQVSLDAHITQILYQPAGLAIAYAGASFDEDAGTATYFVKSVATRKGDKGRTRTLLSQTVHVGENTSPFELIGWTRDAHYLIVRHAALAPLSENAMGEQTEYIGLDVAPDPAMIRPISLPYSTTSFAWSPKHTRILLGQNSNTTYAAYDPAQDKTTPIKTGKGVEAHGWLDETHLLLYKLVPNEKPQWLRYALATGAEEPMAEPKDWPVTPDSAFHDSHDTDGTANAKAPDLRLDVEQHLITDNQRVSAVDSHAIWVRRMGGRPRLSTLPVGLTPGKADPQAQWSPEGNQVAYVAHGDLFLSDLMPRDADATEKMAVGERLNCDEERQIVASDLKQIGLGITQYVQDYDEKWPPAQGFKNAVMPYIKDESLFHFGDVQFTYIAPPGPSLADMESPADVIIGEMDTPCARNVLFADGHVKSFPKAGMMP